MSAGPTSEDRDWLSRQIAGWEISPAITPEQIAGLRARFLAQAPEQRSTAVRLMSVLAVLGALLMGAGAILFIASNWEQIPTYIRLAMIIGLLVAVNEAGFHLRYVYGAYPRVGAGLLLLGAILFGAGIWLVAQVYNIAHLSGRGVLVWAVGILPAGVILGLESITVLSNALLLTWAMMETFDLGHPRTEYFIVSVLFYFPAVYHHKSPKALFLTLCGLVAWLAATGAELKMSGLWIFYLLMSFGAAAYLAGLAHLGREGLRPMSSPYRFTGAWVLFAMAYILGFKDIDREFVYYKAGLASAGVAASPYLWLSAALIAVALVCAVLAARNARPAAMEWWMELSLPALLSLAPALAFVNPGPGVYPVFFNTAAMAIAVGVIALGAARGEEWLINTGFVMFFLLFVTRYVEWAYDYLPKSLFFMISGAILLGAAFFLERKRRALIGAGREDHEPKS